MRTMLPCLALLGLACRGPAVTPANDCDGGVCEVVCATSTISTDAGCQLVLDGLVVSPGALTPPFDPAQSSYEVVVPVSTTAVQVTATLRDGAARVSIDSVTGLSRQVPLLTDRQLISVRVARPFATTDTERRTYSVLVRRSGATPDASVAIDAGPSDAGSADAGAPDGGVTPSVCGAGWPSDAGPFPRFTELRLNGTFANVVTLSPNGSALLVAGSGWFDGTILERINGTWTVAFTITDNPPIEAASFNHDGTMLAVTVPFDDVGCRQRAPPSWTGAIRLYRRGPSGWALDECLTTTPSHPLRALLSGDGSRLLSTAFDTRPRTGPGTPDRIATFERFDGGWAARSEWRADSGYAVRASPDLELIAQGSSGVTDLAWRWPGAPLPLLPPPPGGDSSLFIEPTSANGVAVFAGQYVDRGTTRSLLSYEWNGAGWQMTDALVLDGGSWALGFPGRLNARGAVLVQGASRLLVLERSAMGWRESAIDLPDAGLPNHAFMSTDECLRTVVVATSPNAALIVDLGP